MSHLRARAGNQRNLLGAFVALFSILLFWGSPSPGAFSPNLWFAGTRLILDHAEWQGEAIAVGTTDQGLRRFLARLGATLAYQRGQRYVVITTADRRTISFTLGDSRFTVEGLNFTAPFAPYAGANEAFIPFFALTRAMYVVPVAVGSETVLQPQLGALDVRSTGHAVVVTLRGATPLRFRRTSASDADRVELRFSGMASTLDQNRVVGMPGLTQITVLVSGTPHAPVTSITFEGPAGGLHLMSPSQSSNELVLSFAPPGATLTGAVIPDAGVVTIAPEPVALPVVVASSAAPAVPAPAPAVVTLLDEIPSSDGLNLRIALTGVATYEWHRLFNNRWYVDIRNATLAFPPREDAINGQAVLSVRIKQLESGPVPVVRLALTLPSMRRIEATPSVSDFKVRVATLDDEQPVRIGMGQIGPGARAVAVVGAPVGAVAMIPKAVPAWKFAARSRLIVIDPGHGGSDSGAQQNGLTEKTITLNVSQRLRAVLTARGWNVQMTRDRDVDVFAANDSAHDELQTRCDIANNAGARVFISIHANSFTSSDLNGTTTYYYKSEDLPLADLVQRRLVAALQTKDDGVRKANFYVIRHTVMPAILIETAFLSNPGDAARLASPTVLEKIAAAIADGVGDYAAISVPPITSMLER